MPPEGDKDAIILPDAISHIKASSVCVDKKYAWIQPLVESVLSDCLDDEEISTVALELKRSPKKAKTGSSKKTEVVTLAESGSEAKAIKEISKILNVGLLDIKEPIALDKGLNVFYGKNGAGKSSVYLALCKLFGINKQVYPNLASAIKNSECSLVYEGLDGASKTLNWKTGEVSKSFPIKIFDGGISQILVESDQTNAFKIAHLKLEYFSYLRDLYERVEEVLDRAIDDTDSSITSAEAILEEDVSDLLDLSEEDIEAKLATINFDAKKKKHLASLKKTLETLNKDNPQETLKNIRTASREAVDVLKSIADENDEGEWVLRYDKEKIKSFSDRIENFNLAKKAFEENGRGKIAQLVAGGWIEDDLWNDFVQKSIEFTKTLDHDSQHEYASETCLYCQQHLATPESKSLIKAYGEIASDHESKLRRERGQINELAGDVSREIRMIEDLASTNETIEAEFSHIQKTEPLIPNLEEIVGIYKKIEKGLKDFSAISLTDEEIDKLKTFYKEYESVCEAFGVEIAKLEKLTTDKVESVRSLTAEALPLEEEAIIEKNKKTIISYLASKKEREKLQAKREAVYVLKQSISRAESEFSKVAGLKEFETCLSEEYKRLKFTVPPYWSIKPTTRDGVNKRTYSLDDKRIGDIFSEGERKLHSLADFFAQCEVNKYEGIYIFDDPVNSLDEDNITNVAKRILKLAENNQVIVFTHNLYFLNSLEYETKKVVHLKKMDGLVILESTKLDTASTLKLKIEEMDERMKILEKAPKRSRVDLGVVYDLMSNYLEDYVEKIMFAGIVSRYRANLRMSSLSLLPEMPKDKVKELNDLFDKTSRKGNRHNQTDEEPEPTYAGLVQDYKDLKEKFNYK